MTKPRLRKEEWFVQYCKAIQGLSFSFHLFLWQASTSGEQYLTCPQSSIRFFWLNVIVNNCKTGIHVTIRDGHLPNNLLETVGGEKQCLELVLRLGIYCTAKKESKLDCKANCHPPCSTYFHCLVPKAC